MVDFIKGDRVIRARANILFAEDIGVISKGFQGSLNPTTISGENGFDLISLEIKARKNIS